MYNLDEILEVLKNNLAVKGLVQQYNNDDLLVYTVMKNHIAIKSISQDITLFVCEIPHDSNLEFRLSDIDTLI